MDVGTPASDFEHEEWTRTEVRFHGFASLPSERDVEVESPEFSCFGHEWVLDIYPGGKENSDDGYVAVYLSNMSNKPIKIQYGFSVRDAFGKEVVHHEPETDKFDGARDEYDVENSLGDCDFAKRSKLIKALVKGTLVIEVRMRLIEASKLSSQFIPTNPLSKNILNKFNDEESADIIFEVGSGSKQGKGTRKKAKTTTTTFHAHRLILQDGASTLTEMCKPAGGGSVATVSITDVKPDVFRHMLYYLYGGKLTDEDLQSNAKDIINACDKYGVVSLKLEAEACYVKSTTITVENMMDNLLYADSKNLALLKEAVMDFIVTNKDDIIGKVSFDNVPGSTVTDILTAMSRGEPKKDGDNSSDINYNKMRVGTLRKMLHEKGLGVDGSREAMIALLKENSEESDEVNNDVENE